MKNVKESTLNYNLCVGCGLCKVVCPVDAIEMIYTDVKEWNPKINHKCINCGMCVNYCPHTKEKNLEEAKKICSSKNSNSYGLDIKNNFYVGFDKNEDLRIKSASGGLASFIVKELLEQGKVENIIHVEPIVGKKGEPHYKASISKSVQEIDEKRSSFYSPVEFSEAILEFKNQKSSLAITGVPCFIRGVKKLFLEHPQYNQNKVYYIGLPCSHNVSGQLIDFLGESLGVSSDERYVVNLRAKENNMVDSNNFLNKYVTIDGDVFQENRFKTIFTKIWRGYWFSLNVCHYCSDFWAYEADVSIKDAWGKWAKNEHLGISMVVSRNKEITELLLSSKDKKIQLEEISFDEIKNSQLETTSYKQSNSLFRINKSPNSIYSKQIGFYSKKIVSEISKNIYMENSYEKSYLKISKIEKKVLFNEKIFQLSKLLRKLLRKILK